MPAPPSPEIALRGRTVVVVGRRAPALAAAARLGLRVLLVDEAPLRRADAVGVVRAWQGRFGRGPGEWARLANELAPYGPEAVVATTERAVPPAALLRERLGVPGDDVATATRTTDKLAMKRAVEAAGIPCARYVDAGEGLDAEGLVGRLGLPLVVKGRVSSGGRQNQVVRRRDEVPARLRTGWLAEAFVDGIEMSVESFVHDGTAIFTNPTEYLVDRRANVVPASLPPDDLAAVLELNRRALAALGVRHGMTHLELFRIPAGAVFGEIAARPPGGHITELLEQVYGFDPWEAWLACGLGRPPAFPDRPRRVAAVWVFHPGAGTVARVDGVEAARRLPGVEALVDRLRPGKRVTARLGAGQETGYALVSGADREETVARLLAVRDAIRIEMRPAEAWPTGSVAYPSAP